jgi:hypothetical protein
MASIFVILSPSWISGGDWPELLPENSGWRYERVFVNWLLD